jgi:predicted  nucleic acid-binding Zn-ribbon protein
VKAFPELQSALEKVLAPLNQLSHARRILALGMDDVAGRAVGSGVTTPRAARRALMSRVGQMPASEGDFQRREESGKRQWDQLSQALQRLQLQADSLQALVNGLKRVVEEPRELGLSLDPATLSRYRAEIEANERAVAALHGRIASTARRWSPGRSRSASAISATSTTSRCGGSSRPLWPRR